MISDVTGKACCFNARGLSSRNSGTEIIGKEIKLEYRRTNKRKGTEMEMEIHHKKMISFVKQLIHQCDCFRALNRRAVVKKKK